MPSRSMNANDNKQASINFLQQIWLWWQSLSNRQKWLLLLSVVVLITGIGATVYLTPENQNIHNAKADKFTKTISTPLKSYTQIQAILPNKIHVSPPEGIAGRDCAAKVHEMLDEINTKLPDSLDKILYVLQNKKIAITCVSDSNRPGSGASFQPPMPTQPTAYIKI